MSQSGVSATLKHVLAAMTILGWLLTIPGIVVASGLNGAIGCQMMAIGMILFALRMQWSTHWSTFAFTFWVLAFVFQAFSTPKLFLDWPMGHAKDFISPLIQIIMFGMGTTLRLNDFTRVLLVPKSVAIGMVLQFTVMPLTGWLLASTFGFPPEVAAGVILIGSCPGGVASNVITYLARGDVALSVTMTACSTLMSPIMTPLAMSLLAGSEVEVSFIKMMWSILEITIAPILVGLVASYLLEWLRWRGTTMESFLSAIAMGAICIVIGIIVAQSRDDLMKVGPSLFLATILHNAIGYGLGYYGSKFCKLDESTNRTIAIEVGMQNGGMASALAINVLQSPQAAMAGAIFGPWMSISGSILASFWRRMPTTTSNQDD